MHIESMQFITIIGAGHDDVGVKIYMSDLLPSSIKSQTPNSAMLWNWGCLALSTCKGNELLFSNLHISGSLLHLHIQCSFKVIKT